MKNTMSFFRTLTLSNSAHTIFRSYVTSFVFALITLTSCSDDDNEIDNSADVAKLVGSYTVVDTDEDGEVENYSINITKEKDGGVEISNFGDIMYVPVKATILGNKFNVPAQTFKGKSMTIVISGNGTLNGNTLNFDYTIETDDDYVLEHSCVASKSL
jgi:hypothetical protein